MFLTQWCSSTWKKITNSYWLALPLVLGVLLVVNLTKPLCADDERLFDEISPLTGEYQTPPQILDPIDQDLRPAVYEQTSGQRMQRNWLDRVRVGYDSGFVIAAEQPADLHTDRLPFRMILNGWGQLRHTISNLETNTDQNQFQLKRARLIFSGSAFTPDFQYLVQVDGRSSSGDDIRLLDYRLDYDIGHHTFGLPRNSLKFRTGRWKMPFTLARYLSGKEFQFTDRSMSSTFFDVNRSLGWGLHGRNNWCDVPVDWEIAIFNGLVTGGAETGSSGSLDRNFAYSGRVSLHPTGNWGKGQLADFEQHCCLATRIGFGFANSTISSDGNTEFTRIRVVDSGARLSDLFPSVPSLLQEYTVNLYAIDFSAKYQGWSFTSEYYLRYIDGFQGVNQSRLFDHGLWLQIGKFIVPEKFELISRWSRVVGDSGTLGMNNESADEVAGGFVWYFREQHAKFTCDVTYLNSSPVSSAALDFSPGDMGWYYRSQIQFSF